jgi:RNA polymerase sigma-70 factor, ECF subfamily
MGTGALPKLEVEPDEAPVTLQDQVACAYEQSREEIYRYIVLMGIPREQAQEICQDAFLRLYTVMSRGQQIENLRAWAFTAARNQALSARSSKAWRTASDAEIDERIAAEAPSPEQTVLDREKFRRLRQAVGHLSEQQRHCLHLRTKGFRYREIAEIIGVSTSTVSDAIQSAVKRLRKVLYE